MRLSPKLRAHNRKLLKVHNRDRALSNLQTLQDKDSKLELKRAAFRKRLKQLKAASAQ